MNDNFCQHNHTETLEIESVLKEIPAQKYLQKLGDFFKAFGDYTRLRIICALSQRELCVCQLAEIVGMSQSAVSHQLKYLKSIDIVKYRREGKSIIYSISDTHISHIYGEGLIHIISCAKEEA